MTTGRAVDRFWEISLSGTEVQCKRGNISGGGRKMSSRWFRSLEEAKDEMRRRILQRISWGYAEVVPETPHPEDDLPRPGDDLPRPGDDLPHPEDVMMDALDSVSDGADCSGTGCQWRDVDSVEGGIIQVPSNSLFYPGAGKDVDPAIRFVRSANVSAVVYVDYLVKTSDMNRAIDDFLRRINRMIPRDGDKRFRWEERGEWVETGRHPVKPQDFGFGNQSDFFPTKMTFDVAESIGISAVFVKKYDSIEAERLGRNRRAPQPLNRTVRFLYLNTEAIQTYVRLWSARKIAPRAVVVQNHGKGCLWTPLDGDCLMYRSSAVLPHYLWVGDINSMPWPNYARVSRQVMDESSMYRSYRSLFECVAPSASTPSQLCNGKPECWNNRLLEQFSRISGLQ